MPTLNSLRFSEDTIRQAKHIVQTFGEWDRPQVQGVTIDGTSSLDLDDAFWIEADRDGAILSVHITDVAEVIPLGSALDQATLARVHTRYFKSDNRPMLPRILSENQLSLLEGQPRPTLTFKLRLSPAGQVEGVEIFESWLSSSKRFSYVQADYALTHPTSKWHDLLTACQTWAQHLNHHRRQSGAMGGMKTLSGYYLDENGHLRSNSQARYQSHQIIQEFMIAANTAVARWLAAADCVALYRNHTAKKIAPGQDAILQALLLLGSAEAIRERLQGWLNRAEYCPSSIGHFALNLPAYGHFTSPIRRLADLVNHRVIKAQLRGEGLPYTKLDLENLGCHINQVAETDEERARDYFRAQSQQALQAQIESGQNFQLLSAKELSRLLKHTEGNLKPALKVEVKTRLQLGKLQVQDLYLLLVRGEDRELKQQVMANLHTNIQDAASVLSVAVSQEDTWADLAYQEQPQSEQFLAWVEITIAGRKSTTQAAGIGSRKQAARHQACWLWLEGWWQGTLIAPEQRRLRVAQKDVVVTSEHGVKSLAEIMQHQTMVDNPNHVGTLFEVCVAMAWEPPLFEFEGLAEGFQCTCCLDYEGRSLVGMGTAPKKKQAKQLAAWEVLENLRDC